MITPGKSVRLAIQKRQRFSYSPATPATPALFNLTREGIAMPAPITLTDKEARLIRTVLRTPVCHLKAASSLANRIDQEVTTP